MARPKVSHSKESEPPEPDLEFLRDMAAVRREIAIHQETLEREGWQTHGYRGQPVVHPAARLLEAARLELSRLERRNRLAGQAEPKDEVPAGDPIFVTVGPPTRSPMLREWEPDPERKRSWRRCGSS